MKTFVYDRFLAYHSLHIQYCSALIDVLLCCYGTSWEFHGKDPLELPNMVFHITLHVRDLHQLCGIHLTESLNIHGPTFLIYAMMPLGIVLEDFINLIEFEFLTIKQELA